MFGDNDQNVKYKDWKTEKLNTTLYNSNHYPVKSRTYAAGLGRATNRDGRLASVATVTESLP